MLGYKANLSVKPSYDHYHDTDIDNTGDQLVDFSKRYPENEPEEVCRPSAVKNPQLALTSMNSEENKQPDDEVKVYCIEGTPIMTSSASSYCDLREVGIIEHNSEALILEEQTTKEHCFSSTHNFSIETTESTKNSVNSNLIVDEIQGEKIELNKEEECVNQEAEAAFTKSSSPLMFSRSSSVGSLNSFEQHSIVDDRSSVSAFSNLASGMISPSEIPDSPFEVASPFISKNKNNEFLFPSNDKSVDTVLVDQTIPNGDFPGEAFGDCSEDDIKVYDDEGDCNSISNLSALSFQANSTRVSISVIQSKDTHISFTQKSSVTVNCSVSDTEPDFIEKCQNLEIIHDSYVVEQNCINTICSHPSVINDVNKNEKNQNIETKYEDKGTSTSEDFNFLDNNYEQSASPFKNIKASTPMKNKIKDVNSLIFMKTCRQQYELQQSSDNSKDNSDDESDALLKECILSGMPGKDNAGVNASKQSLNHSFQTSESSLKESLDAPNCSLSDNYVSEDDDNDDDDGIVKECVILGMPQKSNNLEIQTDKSSVSEPASKSPTHTLKLFDDASYDSTVLSQESEKNTGVVPKSVSNLRSFVKEEEFSTYNLISQSKDQLDDIKKDLAKSDDDSDNDESDLLVQELIQLGMPKSQLKSPKETKLPIIFPPNKDLGCRDNCPDGVSDGEDDDDDDDILNEIIIAGKPNTNSETNKSPYAESKPSLKSQNQKRMTAAEDRALFLNKYYYGNIPKDIVRTASANTFIGIDDSTCVYRTEDTPILSPSASLSDLSTLSFTEDKVCQESFLNNSRNSEDCSSESEDDELLRQCIRQGMPGARRVAA